MVARSSYGDGWETRVVSMRGDAIIGSPEQGYEYYRREP